MWESPFMVLRKLDSIIYQYAFKLELSDKFRYKPPVSNFAKVCGTVNGISGKVLLCLYV
jgi:hypothetical protein